MLTMRETVVKAHVGRWTEDCPEHSGCVVYNMADIPLGFGVVSPFHSCSCCGIANHLITDCQEYG